MSSKLASRGRDVAELLADRVRRGRGVGGVGVLLLAGEHPRPHVGELGAADGRPPARPLREGLVEPQVVPPAHGHHVAEPHVRHLVQQHQGPQLAFGVRRRVAEDEGVAPGDAAVVLHGAAHLRGEHLVIARLGERHRELLAEEGQPLGGDVEQLLGVALEHRRDGAAGIEPEVEARTAAAQLDEGAGVDHRDVRRQRRRVGVRPRAHAVARGDLGVAGVARDQPPFRHVDGDPEHRLEVGLVEAREDHARVVGFEARPHVHLAVARVHGAMHALARRSPALHRAHDQQVVGLQVRKLQASPRRRTTRQRDAVEDGLLDVAETVDERRRPRRRGREGDRRRGAQRVTRREAGQVEVEVVAADLEERGPLPGLVLGQAEGIGHPGRLTAPDSRRTE